MTEFEIQSAFSFVILKAKTALKQEVLDSAINKRRKNIYFDFILKYSKTLGEKEKI